MKILAGSETLDYGSIARTRGISAGYLPQDGLTLTGRTVFAECMSVFDDLRQMEQELVSSMEDWIVYVLDPEAYRRQSFLGWDEKELTQMTGWVSKRVIDIGSGTGKQAFITAPLCHAVYCVEPVYNLRRFLKQRAQREGIQNLFVTDGLMTSLPFENAFADVITSGHVYGDEPALEVAEMLRVLKPGGMVILIPGNNDVDSPSHQYLVDSGFQWSRMSFPTDGYKRKYWKIKES
jgi:SAM-dependent methyltransferase